MSNAENLDVFHRDTLLPGLELVLNSSKVQELLGSKFRLNRSEHIELDYIRYKPGRRALSLMHIVDANGMRQPIVVNACSSNSWNKFMAHEAAELQPSTVVDEDRRAYIHWFPCDRRLKQIAKLFDASKINKVLNRVIGKPPEDHWRLETLAYKPNRRYVSKASSGSVVLALKCYTPKDYSEAKAKILSVANAEIEHCNPSLVGSSDHYAMIATRWIEGETLSSDCDDTFALDRFSQAGALLANWHGNANHQLRSICQRHPGFLPESIAQLAKDIQWLSPELENPLQQLLSKIDRHLCQLDLDRDVIHGDFYAKQIIEQDDQLHLIDFDEISRGHRYQDLGTMVGNLYWNASRNATDVLRVEQVIEAFTTGYEREMGHLHWPIFQTSVVAGILRCLPHPFRRGLPNWREKMWQMLDFAMQWCPTRLNTVDHGKANSRSGPEQKQYAGEQQSEECIPYLDTVRVNEYWKHGEAFTSDLNGTTVQQSQLLRHKSGRRILVEYTLHSPTCKPKQVIGKARFKKPIDERVLQLHHDLNESRDQGFQVPRVLGKIPSLNLWLQEKVFGESITPSSPNAMHRTVGQALAAFHCSSAKISRHHSVEQELAILSDQFQQWLNPLTQFAFQSETLLKTCYQRALELTPVQQTILHRDFYFDQVLYCRQGVAIVDLDLAAMGDPELDVGNYLAHLDEYGLRNRLEPHHNGHAADSFLSGYLDVRPFLDLSNVEIWRYLSLARLTAISRRIIERTRTTSALLDLCEQKCQRASA